MYRVYGFAAVLAIAIMAALLILPRYTRAPRYLEPHAALVQYLIERWSAKNPQEFRSAMTRIESRVRAVGSGRFVLPDGSERYLVTEARLLALASQLDGEQIDPVKTTIVQNQRSMTTWEISELR